MNKWEHTWCKQCSYPIWYKRCLYKRRCDLPTPVISYLFWQMRIMEGVRESWKIMKMRNALCTNCKGRVMQTLITDLPRSLQVLRNDPVRRKGISADLLPYGKQNWQILHNRLTNKEITKNKAYKEFEWWCQLFSCPDQRANLTQLAP